VRIHQVSSGVCGTDNFVVHYGKNIQQRHGRVWYFSKVYENLAISWQHLSCRIMNHKMLPKQTCWQNVIHVNKENVAAISSTQSYIHHTGTVYHITSHTRSHCQSSAVVLKTSLQVLLPVTMSLCPRIDIVIFRHTNRFSYLLTYVHKLFTRP